MRAELDKREVESVGLGILKVGWDYVCTIQLSFELPQSQDERAMVIFRKNGFCWFVYPFAKTGNT